MGRGVRFPFHPWWRRNRLSAAQAFGESSSEHLPTGDGPGEVERPHERFQGLPENCPGRLPAIPLATLQPYRRVAAEDHCSGVLVDHDANNLAQPARRDL